MAQSQVALIMHKNKSYTTFSLLGFNCSPVLLLINQRIEENQEQSIQSNIKTLEMPDSSISMTVEHRREIQQEESRVKTSQSDELKLSPGKTIRNRAVHQPKCVFLSHIARDG